MDFLKAFQLLLILCCVLGTQLSCPAEEPPTPSDKMKDAIGKLTKTPASIRESLQGLTDAAAAKIKQSIGDSAKPAAEFKPADLSMPPKSAEAPVAAHALKLDGRDPFRPMTLRTKTGPRSRENLSPLERLDLGQLKIVGIVWDIKEPRAMVEDTAGLGYTVKIGTPIGSNDGRVKNIQRDQIIVEEYFEDSYGARKKHDVAMRLSTE